MVNLPPSYRADFPQLFDFAFSFEGRKVAVEVEMANHEKILRDILKCHMYLQAGADYAMVVLPTNYPHRHRLSNVFDFGMKRFAECQTYGFGRPELLERILLLGFDQYDSQTSVLLSRATRELMRSEPAASGPGLAVELPSAG